MAKVVACIIARTVSKRLPLKVLRDLHTGVSMLEFLIRRIKAVECIDEVYVCTSKENVDDILEDVAVRCNVKLYRGSADEVIERMIAVGNLEKADILLRITGDNPFTSTEYIPGQLSLLLEKKLDYTRVIEVPIGATAELMTFDALKKCNEMMDPSVSEYLMLYMFEPKNFRCGVIKPFTENFSDYSLTVDTYNDFERSRGLLKALEWEVGRAVLLSDVMKVYQNENISLVARKISSGGDVKLPYGKVVPFSEFSADMQRRVDESTLVKLYE
jgi:spore coat polysaccharide biosynthesis protein SpsF